MMGSRIAAALTVATGVIVLWGLVVSNAIAVLLTRVPILTR